MKFLPLFTHSKRTDDSARFLAFAGSGVETEGAGEERAFLRAQENLKNPYKLSQKDLKVLEKNSDLLNAEDKKLLNGALEFHLSMLQKNGTETVANSFVTGVKFSKLWNLVSPALRVQVEGVMSRDHEQVKAIMAKRKESLSTNDRMHLLRIYRHMRTQKNVDKKLFDQVSETILKTTQSLIAEYEVTSTERGIEALNRSKKFQLQDKIFLLEASQVFPEVEQAQSLITAEQNAKLAMLSDSILKEIIKDLGDGPDGNKKFKRVEYLGSWEAVEALANGQTLSTAPENVRQTLNRLVQASQTAQFLHWAKNWKTFNGGLFLPEHVKALRSIKKDKEAEVNAVHTIFGAEKEMTDSEFQIFLQEWTEEKGDIKLQTKEKGEDDKESFEEASALDRVTEEQKKLNDPRTQFAAFKTKYEAIEAELRPLLSEDESFRNAWGEVPHEAVTLGVALTNPDWETSAEPFDDNILSQKLQEVHEYARNKRGTLAASNEEEEKAKANDYQKASEILDKFSSDLYEESYSKKKKEIDEQASKVRSQAMSQEAQLKEYVDLMQTIHGAPDEAGTLLGQYSEGLKTRIGERRLTGADMSVILQDEDAYELLGKEFYSHDLINIIRNFRDQFKTALVDPIINQLKANQPLNETDFLIELGQKLELGSILKNPDLKPVITELKYQLDGTEIPIKSVIDGIMASFRTDIWEQVRLSYPDLVGRISHNISGRAKTILDIEKATAGERHLHEVMSRYERAHQGLYDHEAIQKGMDAVGDYRRKLSSDQSELNRIKQATNKALGGASKQKIASYLNAYIPAVPVEKIHQALDSVTHTDIIAGNNETLLSQLQAQLPELGPLLQYRPDKKDEILTELGKLVVREGAAQAFDKAIESSSYNLNEGNDKFLGTKVLSEMALQLSPFIQEANILQKRLDYHLLTMQDRLKRGEHFTGAQLQAEFVKPVEDQVVNRLDLIGREAAQILNDLFPEYKERFNDRYLKTFNEKLDLLKEHLNSCSQAYANSQMDGVSGIEDLEEIRKVFMGVAGSLDLGKDRWGGVVGALKDTHKHIPETAQFLDDELGLLKPGGYEEAKRNFEKEQAKAKQEAEAFFALSNEVLQIWEKDIKEIDDKKFKLLYHVDKPTMMKYLDDYQNLTEDIVEGFYNPFLKDGDFFPQWFQRYADPDQQIQAINDMNFFHEWKDYMFEKPYYEKAKEGLLDFRKGYKENRKAVDIGAFDHLVRRPWRFLKSIRYENGATLLSIYHVIIEVYELTGKRWERTKDRRKAWLGSKLFGDTAWGKEFQRVANEKEQERIEDYKRIHQKANYQVLQERMKNPGNQDEARAVIELMIEKGYLRWDDPEFLRMLMRFQHGVRFNLPEDIENYVENPAGLKLKIGDAVSVIWDQPTWLNWKADMTSKYESEMGKHKADYREEVQKGSVDAYLSDMLEKWALGEIDENFERAKFEAYIYEAFDNGEMNGYPAGDRRWFYLIKGLTTKLGGTGETILSTDALSRLGKLQGKMPYTDAFDDGVGWKLNGKVVPEGTPGAHQGSWDYNDIQHWNKYFDHISGFNGTPEEVTVAVRRWLNDSLVPTFDAQDRMGKVQLTDIDRDDAGILPLLLSPERLRSVLVFASGDKRPVDDKYYVQLLDSFENNLKDTIHNYRTFEKNYEDSEGYDELKQTNLLRIGQMLRNYFLMSQTMAGNWDAESHVGAVVLSDIEWEKNKLDEKYKNIVGVVGKLFGDDGEVTSLVDVHNKEQEPSKHKDKSIQYTADKVKKIYEDTRFTDLGLIENFIKNI